MRTFQQSARTLAYRGLVAWLAMFLLVGTFSLWNHLSTLELLRRVDRTNEVLLEIGTRFSAMQDIETGIVKLPAVVAMPQLV